MREALQYGTTPGLLALREEIARRMTEADGLPEGTITSPRVFLGTGSQQLLYLLAEILLDPGDIVLAGVPAYFVYLGALASFGVRVVPVRTDRDGVDPADLRHQLEELDRAGLLNRVKFIYDVPYFNNPTGWTLSAARRPQVVALAKEFSHHQRILILEDAAYRELRYDGADVPSMLSHDSRGEHVLYAGTFSKPFAPGVRTGWMVVPEDLIEPLTLQKGHHDFGSASFNQHLLLSILKTGIYERHLTHLTNVYSRKRSVFLDILRSELASHAGELTWTEPEGGLYVWVRLPASVGTRVGGDFFEECLSNGVLYVPGNFCYPNEADPAASHELRLSFGHPSAERCEEGMRRFCRVLQHRLGRTGRVSHARPPV